MVDLTPTPALCQPCGQTALGRRTPTTWWCRSRSSSFPSCRCLPAMGWPPALAT